MLEKYKELFIQEPEKPHFIIRAVKGIEDLAVSFFKPKIYIALKKEQDESFKLDSTHSYKELQCISEDELNALLNEIEEKKSRWKKPVFRQIKTVYNFLFNNAEYQKNYIANRLRMAGRSEKAVLSYLSKNMQKEPYKKEFETKKDFVKTKQSVIKKSETGGNGNPILITHQQLDINKRSDDVSRGARV